MPRERCPFGKLDCNDCKLYRRGIRLVGVEQREEKIEACVFHIIADNLEEVHRKVLSMQAEVGEMKGISVLKTMVDLVPEADRPRSELVKALKKYQVPLRSPDVAS